MYYIQFSSPGMVSFDTTSRQSRPTALSVSLVTSVCGFPCQLQVQTPYSSLSCCCFLGGILVPQKLSYPYSDFVEFLLVDHDGAVTFLCFDRHPSRAERSKTCNRQLSILADVAVISCANEAQRSVTGWLANLSKLPILRKHKILDYVQ